jgi:hypothetical protein
MQPTLNPTSKSSHSRSSSNSSSSSESDSDASRSSTSSSSSSSSGDDGAQSDWVLVDKWSVKVRHAYGRGDVVMLW